MTGGYNDYYEPLVDPAEIVAVAPVSLTDLSVRRANEIIKEWKKSGGEMFWAVGLIYEVGRIQGIREERQRRRSKN